MNNTYLLTLNQVHSAVERYTTDALFARNLKCKPGFVQRGAACQPINMAKGGLGQQSAYMFEEPAPTQNGGGSIFGGIAKGALAGGGVGLLAGVGSGLNDEFRKSMVGSDGGTVVNNTRNQRNIGKRLVKLGGVGASSLTYSLTTPNTTGHPLDRIVGRVAAGLAGGAAASGGYGLGKNLTRMAVNALREQNKSVATGTR